MEPNTDYSQYARAVSWVILTQERIDVPRLQSVGGEDATVVRHLAEGKGNLATVQRSMFDNDARNIRCAVNVPSATVGLRTIRTWNGFKSGMTTSTIQISQERGGRYAK